MTENERLQHRLNHIAWLIEQMEKKKQLCKLFTMPFYLLDMNLVNFLNMYDCKVVDLRS